MTNGGAAGRTWAARPRRRFGRALRLGLLLWLAPVLGGPWHWPERWNPWAPLDIDAEPNLLTRYKLSRLDADPARCRAVLAAAGLDHQPLEDTAPAPGCGLHDAVRVERSIFEVGTPFPLTCRAAVSLALWERHVVMPAAARHLRRPVVRIDHFGSYACRDIAGREGSGGMRSRHAVADALDVAGFTLAGGRRITVTRDWRGVAGSAGGMGSASGAGGAGGADGADGGAAPTPESAFLREVHDGACRYFDVVLGPAYNAAHRDHFHLDRGGGRACR